MIRVVCALLLTSACSSVLALNVTTFGDSALVLEPGRMGPNALPVPLIDNAYIDSNLLVTLAGDYYVDPRGDTTVNPFFSIAIPLGQQVGFKIFSRPVEHFRTNAATRDYRHAKNLQGSTPGDLSFQTLIQIAREQTFPCDVLFSLTLKTTTGKGLVDARHINAPAYFFTLNQGRTLLAAPVNLTLTTSLSFIAWQVNVNEQNDAVGYGIRLAAQKNGWHASTELAGYSGWIHNGDQPLVVRASLERACNVSVIIFAMGQYGFRDQAKYLLNAGAKLNLSKLFFAK